MYRQADLSKTKAPGSGVKTGLRMGALLVCGILLGWLLLTLCYALPTRPILAHTEESLVVFWEQNGSGEDLNQALAKTYVNTWLDNRTDLLMMQFAAYRNDQPLYRQAAMSYRMDDGENMLTSLERLVRGDMDELTQVSYGRYWQGYLIFLKPLLSVCNYMDIRMLNMLAQGVLYALLLWAMQKRGLGRYLPALCGSLLLLTPWVLPGSLQYSTSLYPMLLGMLLVLTCPRFIRERLGAAPFFMLLGMVTSYLDLLTFPLITFGMPFLLWTLLMDERSVKKSLLMLVKLGGAWLLGYLGMWAGKWALVLLFGTPAEAAEILTAIRERSSAEELSRWAALRRNIQVYLRKPFKLMSLVALAMTAAAWVRVKGRRRKAGWALPLVWLLVGILPFCWYYVMAQHSHTHYFYTHRILAVAGFAAFCLLTRWTEPEPIKD